MFIGINVGKHDSSVCLLNDDFSFTIYEEERFTKVKNAGYFPFASILNLKKDIDTSKINNNHVAFSSCVTTVEENIKYSQANIKNRYSLVYKDDEKLSLENKDAHEIIHHEAHLFSVLPGLDKSIPHLIVVSDGYGSPTHDLEGKALFLNEKPETNEEYESISIYLYENNKVTLIEKKFTKYYLSQYPKDIIPSPSLFYMGSADLVFGSWKYSGKVMGLSAYNKAQILAPIELKRIIHNGVINKKNKNHEGPLYNFSNLSDEQFQETSQICASVQAYFENYNFNLFNELKTKYPHIENIAYTGGSALNCIFNEKLRKKAIFKNLIIPPWSNDEGISLGAAVAAYYKINGEVPYHSDFFFPFRGRNTDFNNEVEATFNEYRVEKLDLNKVVDLLTDEKIIAWFRPQSECGPRALGHRSIYCLPTVKGIKDTLNAKVKFREFFRPYGCSALKENMDKYFEDTQTLNSPFMTFAPIVKEEYKEKLSEVVHPDGSIRIQTVTKDFDLLFELLELLKSKTGESIIIHTSLNINKQPILENLNDAKRFLDQSAINFMVVGDFLISK